MGGFFGVASDSDCVPDVYFGTDYHSHLGTRRGGMAFYGPRGFDRTIHDISNVPFRSRFIKDAETIKGNMGIGCISDYDPQPLLVRSRLGNYAIVTVGHIGNADELIEEAFRKGQNHFLEMSGNNINATELTASLINQGETFAEGIRHAQESIKGSMSILLLTQGGIYAARDRMGRTPMFVGSKGGSTCVSFESFAFINLGYALKKELGPAEIAFLTPGGCEVVRQPLDGLKICAFLWIYYGYPPSVYEGMGVEESRYRCGASLARMDGGGGGWADTVAGVPDSGTTYAIGYSNESGIPFARPFIKYTSTWARSFMPHAQKQRDLIARMKLIPVGGLIDGKRLLLIDDSVVRGTQLREQISSLFKAGAEEVHARIACPPILFPCKHLNFSRTTTEDELLSRKVIGRFDPGLSHEGLAEYADLEGAKGRRLVEGIRGAFKLTTLKFQCLDKMKESIGVNPCSLCTYCWDGRK